MDDKSFIFSTFLRGLYYGSDFFKEVDKEAFMAHYHKVLDHVLNQPGTSVEIACLEDAPNVILGYIIYKDNRLDWIFVKKAWRGIGIAKRLTPGKINTITHLTTIGKSILKKHKGIKFNPFAII